MPDADAIDAIDALLPQTQCRRCHYDGCRPYAEAIARGEAAINRCPPGGVAGIRALAGLLKTAPLPLDPDCGVHADTGVAVIDERRCIGCARCLPPCPVDAILGASRHMHTVLEDLCNGCELCLASCPVDCISMQPRSSATRAPQPSENRERYQGHVARLERNARQRAELLSERKRTAPTDRRDS
jgi:electron transport complex protein RnfB